MAFDVQDERWFGCGTIFAVGITGYGVYEYGKLNGRITGREEARREIEEKDQLLITGREEARKEIEEKNQLLITGREEARREIEEKDQMLITANRIIAEKTDHVKAQDAAAERQSEDHKNKVCRMYAEAARLITNGEVREDALKDKIKEFHLTIEVLKSSTSRFFDVLSLEQMKKIVLLHSDDDKQLCKWLSEAEESEVLKFCTHRIVEHPEAYQTAIDTSLQNNERVVRDHEQLRKDQHELSARLQEKEALHNELHKRYLEYVFKETHVERVARYQLQLKYDALEVHYTTLQGQYTTVNQEYSRMKINLCSVFSVIEAKMISISKKDSEGLELSIVNVVQEMQGRVDRRPNSHGKEFFREFGTLLQTWLGSLSRKAAEIQKLEARVQNLKDNVQESKGLRSTDKRRLGEAAMGIATLRTAQRNLDQQLASTKLELDDKSQSLEKLNQQLQSTTSQLDDKSQSLEKARAEVKVMEKLRSEKGQLVKDLETQKRKRLFDISNLKDMREALDESQRSIDDLQAVSNGKDKRITELEAAGQQYKSAIRTQKEDFDRQMREKDEAIVTLLQQAGQRSLENVKCMRYVKMGVAVQNYHLASAKRRCEASDKESTTARSQLASVLYVQHQKDRADKQNDEELKTRLATIEKEKGECAALQAQTSTELSKAKSELAASAARIAVLERSESQSQTQLSETRAAHKSSEQGLATANSQVAALQSSKDAVDAEIASIQEKVKVLEETGKQQLSKLDDAYSQLHSLQSAKDKTDAEVKSLKEQLKGAVNEASIAKKKLEISNEQWYKWGEAKLAALDKADDEAQKKYEAAEAITDRILQPQSLFSHYLKICGSGHRTWSRLDSNAECIMCNGMRGELRALNAVLFSVECETCLENFMSEQEWNEHSETSGNTQHRTVIDEIILDEDNESETTAPVEIDAKSADDHLEDSEDLDDADEPVTDREPCSSELAHEGLAGGPNDDVDDGKLHDDAVLTVLDSEAFKVTPSSSRSLPVDLTRSSPATSARLAPSTPPSSPCPPPQSPVYSAPGVNTIVTTFPCGASFEDAETKQSHINHLRFCQASECVTLRNGELTICFLCKQSVKLGEMMVAHARRHRSDGMRAKREAAKKVAHRQFSTSQRTPTQAAGPSFSTSRHVRVSFRSEQYAETAKTGQCPGPALPQGSQENTPTRFQQDLVNVPSVIVGMKESFEPSQASHHEQIAQKAPPSLMMDYFAKHFGMTLEKLADTYSEVAQALNITLEEFVSTMKQSGIDEQKMLTNMSEGGPSMQDPQLVLDKQEDCSGEALQAPIITQETDQHHDIGSFNKYKDFRDSEPGISNFLKARQLTTQDDLSLTLMSPRRASVTGFAPYSHPGTQDDSRVDGLECERWNSVWGCKKACCQLVHECSKCSSPDHIVAYCYFEGP
ncbi:hypothetical protein K491DRAFT_750771 [Lophiostoma macrostomum CBS 122681]|uniref:Uncharacterized protein n=1 Tax=Lophiostoma macrostomum CBS 122681 TaxID=1314788 RepID=A0A6A6TMN3_9PLEO|nr:hypothetical protein K491DRAFT_750771 [Lophiostoma macrostomum CBS 122681]